MTEATEVVANALDFEAKKHGMNQAQSGEWSITFKIHPEDMPFGLLPAAMGTRFQVAVVELDDDETPKQQSDEAKAKPVSETKERRRMDQLPYPQQAALMCQDMRFTKFLEETNLLELADGLDAETQTATAVRKYCDVNSRAQFATNQYAANKWLDLVADFEAWKDTP